MTNLQIKQALLEGRQVQTKLHGNSMTPKINSGDVVIIDPWPDGPIDKGDIVFCKVNGNFYLHLVTGRRFSPSGGGSPKTPSFVQISNNHFGLNPATNLPYTFSRLVQPLTCP